MKKPVLMSILRATDAVAAAPTLGRFVRRLRSLDARSRVVAVPDAAGWYDVIVEGRRVLVRVCDGHVVVATSVATGVMLPVRKRGRSGWAAARAALSHLEPAPEPVRAIALKIHTVKQDSISRSKWPDPLLRWCTSVRAVFLEPTHPESDVDRPGRTHVALGVADVAHRASPTLPMPSGELEEDVLPLVVPLARAEHLASEDAHYHPRARHIWSRMMKNHELRHVPYDGEALADCALRLADEVDAITHRDSCIRRRHGRECRGYAGCAADCDIPF